MRSRFRVEDRRKPAARGYASAVVERLEGRDLMALVVGPVVATEDQTFQGKVANFSASDVVGVAADASASIAWGDGTVTAGQVIAASGSTFDVVGIKTYPRPGRFPVVVTLTAADPAKTTTAAQGEARVAAVPVTLAAVPFTTTVGQAATHTVATFSDPGGAIGDDTATIHWGDGEATTDGKITGGDGSFRVEGTYAYRSPGNKTATVTLVRVPTGQVATADASATVVTSALTSSGTVFAATANKSFSGTVASFVDTDTTKSISDYTAVINWGPGLPSTVGSVGGSAGQFTVSGTFTYGDPGTRAVSVTITRPATGQSTVATSSAIVAPSIVATGSNLTSSGTVFAATANKPFTGTVASFVDTDTTKSISDYTAVINWGPGLPSTVGSVGGSAGQYTVSGTFTYADPGTRAVSVTITRPATGQSTVATSSAIVAPSIVATGSNLTSSGTVFAATANKPFTGTVASFVDTDTTKSISDYTAVINWGPGLPSTVGSVGGSAGQYTVSGTFTYADPGTRAVSVTITRPATGQSTVATSSAIVAPSIVATGTSLTAVKGQQFTAVVASFVDQSLTGTAASYGATIAWGTGETSTLGTVVPVAGVPGRFDVIGTYAYTTSGPFTVDVTIARADTGQTASAKTAAVVALPLIGSGLPIAATAGQTFQGPVASFTDPDPTANTDPATFTATISWGDGTTSMGTISYVKPDKATTGAFLVFGSNTYASAGTFPVRVTLVRKVTGTAYALDATATVRAFVGALDPLVDLGGSDHDGITSDNQPRFLGTVEPLALVRLFARKTDRATAIPIGETIAGSNGKWSLTAPPLADGSYAITGEVVPTTGSAYTPGPIATIQIDTVAPRTLGVSYNPKTGRITATFRDDQSGMDRTRLLDRANYALLGQGRTRVVASQVLDQTPAGAQSTDPRTVVVRFTLAPRFRAGNHTLRVVAGTLTDLAGNALVRSSFGARSVVGASHPGRAVAKTH